MMAVVPASYDHLICTGGATKLTCAFSFESYVQSRDIIESALLILISIKSPAMDSTVYIWLFHHIKFAMYQERLVHQLFS